MENFVRELKIATEVMGQKITLYHSDTMENGRGQGSGRDKGGTVCEITKDDVTVSACRCDAELACRKATELLHQAVSDANARRVEDAKVAKDLAQFQQEEKEMEEKGE